MSERLTFGFHRGRLVRNLIGLLPLAGFPLAIHLVEAGDLVIDSLFAVAAVVLVLAVLYSAARFKVSLTADTLELRGRLHHRHLPLASLREVRVRRGRGKAPRFMGPPPFRELVLRTDERRLVISSLPLGEEAFEQLIGALAKRLPPEVFPGT